MIIIIAIYLAISTPLPSRVTYACAGNSEMLRSEWAVWEAVANGQCTVVVN